MRSERIDFGSRGGVTSHSWQFRDSNASLALGGMATGLSTQAALNAIGVPSGAARTAASSGTIAVLRGNDLQPISNLARIALGSGRSETTYQDGSSVIAELDGGLQRLTNPSVRRTDLDANGRIREERTTNMADGGEEVKTFYPNGKVKTSTYTSEYGQVYTKEYDEQGKESNPSGTGGGQEQSGGGCSLQ
jgi:hypothetical protein